MVNIPSKRVAAMSFVSAIGVSARIPRIVRCCKPEFMTTTAAANGIADAA